jgi:hypothetical protein
MAVKDELLQAGQKQAHTKANTAQSFSDRSLCDEYVFAHYRHQLKGSGWYVGKGE